MSNSSFHEVLLPPLEVPSLVGEKVDFMLNDQVFSSLPTAQESKAFKDKGIVVCWWRTTATRSATADGRNVHTLGIP
jgi:hypothetical protein